MTKISTSLSQAFEARLTEGALPGEIESFGPEARAEAARFVAETAGTRTRGAATPTKR